jgi:predicted dienelactone hydrolase
MTVFLMAVALPIVAEEELYKADQGPLEVKIVKDLTLRDEARGKDLPVRVTYPIGEGPFPLIVFSHGAWAARDFYVPLATHWASHGYVVVQPTHEDSTTLGQKWRDPVVFSAPFWQSRVEDVKFLIDSLNDLGVPELKGKIDGDRVGVGGHSYGASTTMAVGGVTLFNPENDDSVSYGDPRVKAIAALSGQGLGTTLTRDSWKSIQIPMYVLTGTNDPGRGGQSYEWRIEPFTFAAPGNKHLLVIEDADHSFGGMTDSEEGPPKNRVRNYPRRPDHVDYVQSSTTAFWDAHLLGVDEAEAFLATGHMDRLTGGAVNLQAK